MYLIRLNFFFLFLYFVNQAFSLSADISSEVLKYTDAGYPRESVYKGNYRLSKTQWYKLSDHLNLNPKFLILVEQPLRLNNEEVKYKFIYNSAHNFFSMVRKDQKKRSIVPGLPINIFQTKTLVAPKIDDKNITLQQFVEKAFDHCHYTNMVSAKDSDGKSIKMSKYGMCRITMINAIKMKPFTEEEYNKNNQDLLKFTSNNQGLIALINNQNKTKNLKKEKLEVTSKNDTKEKQLKLNKKKQNLIDFKNKNYLVSLSWSKLDKLSVGSLVFDNNRSGKIQIKLTKSGGTCVGTIAITGTIGSWSISCPNDDKRPKGLHNTLSASGSLSVDENFSVIGSGQDILNNKIEFVANFIN